MVFKLKHNCNLSTLFPSGWFYIFFAAIFSQQQQQPVSMNKCFTLNYSAFVIFTTHPRNQNNQTNNQINTLKKIQSVSIKVNQSSNCLADFLFLLVETKDMALDRNQLIRTNSSRLVEALVPREFGEEYKTSISNEIFIHITSLSPETWSGRDVETIITRFKQYFIRQGLSSEWGAFQSVVERLLRLKTVDQAVNYLLLFNGSGEGEGEKVLHSSPVAPFGNPQQNQPGINLANIHNPMQSQFTSPASKTLSQSIEPFYTSLDEPTIITYLSYSLLGIDSKLFTFKGDTIELPPDINHSYSSLLHDILEPALIYKNLITGLGTSNTSASQQGDSTHSSPIKIAFLRSLESRLNQYTTHINTIFQSQPSSLISIYNQLSLPVEELRILYTIFALYYPLKTYDFLSEIYSLSKFGDPSIKELTSSILMEVSRPYFEILENWILKGELIDNSNEEFFVCYDLQGTNLNDIIQYVPERIPNEKFLNYFNKSIGEKIFQIGKMLIFLEKYCKELKWVNEFGRKYSNRIGLAIQSLTRNEFTSLINDQYEELLGYFTHLVQEKYKLFDHLRNFKTFLLMQSNDFIESLIQNGMRLFNEPANSLTTSQLSKILIDSIHSSSIKSLPIEFQDRLDARILNLNNGSEGSNGAIGWEVFTLEYKINDLPIEHILNYKNGLLGYLKMFNFLWKLKNLNYLLNLGYVESSRLMKEDLKKIRLKYNRIKRQYSTQNVSIRDRKIYWLMNSFRSICLIRNQIIKFFGVLLRYLSIDIIENSFEELKGKMKRFEKRRATKKSGTQNAEYDSIKTSSLKPSSAFMEKLSQEVHSQTSKEDKSDDLSIPLTIDELINIHTSYLTSIIGCKLLNENEIGSVSGESLVIQIYDFFDITFQFIKGSEEFESLVVKYISILNIDEQRSGDLMDDDLDDDLVEIEENLKNIIDKLRHQLYFSTFKPKLDIFTRDLRGTLDLRELSKLL